MNASDEYIERETNCAGRILVCRACFTNIGIRKMSDTVLSIYCRVTNTARQEDENLCFPVCICRTCLVLLRKLYNFQLHCQRSYVQLQKLALWGKLDTYSLVSLGNAKSIYGSLSFSSTTKVIHCIPSDDLINTPSELKLYRPARPQNNSAFQVNNHNNAHLPYQLENTGINVLFNKQINSPQPNTQNQNERKNPILLKSLISPSPCLQLENNNKSQVFVASCAKGRRTLTLEKGRDNTNPAAHNDAIPATTSTLSNDRPVQKQRAAIVINKGVIENLPTLALNNGTFLDPPPLATTLTAVDSAAVVTNKEKLPEHYIFPLQVLNDGRLQMTYDAAKAVLEVAQVGDPAGASQNHESHLKRGKRTNEPINYRLLPKVDKIEENPNTNASLLNDNVVAPYPNITDAIIGNSTIKTETENDEQQTICDNDEPDANIDEVTDIKRELDDIVKVEHLIHPVEDYEEQIDEENMRQKDQNQNQQQGITTIQTETSQPDDKIVEIDDSSSSSSDSSSTSSSSSSSTSSDSDSDVEAVDLTLEDDEAIVATKKTDTLTNSVNETDGDNDSDPGQDTTYKNTNAAKTDETLIKKSLLEINIADIESSTKVEKSKSTSSEDAMFDDNKISVKSEPSSLEIHKTRFAGDATAKIDKDAANTIRRNTDIVEDSAKTVDTAAVKDTANIAKHIPENVESMDKNVEAVNFDSTASVGTMEEEVATTAIIGKSSSEGTTITVEDMTKTVEIDVKDMGTVVQNVDTGTLVKDTANTDHVHDTTIIVKESTENVESEAIAVKTIVKDTAKNVGKSVRVKNATGIIKTVKASSKIVEDTAQIPEVTTKTIEVVTEVVENIAKTVEGTRHVVNTKTVKQSKLGAPYYDYDSSSTNSDDLPDCLIGFNRDVYRKDSKRNFTGPEYGVQVKKQKIRYLDEELKKELREEEKMEKYYEYIFQKCRTNVKHKMTLRSRDNTRVSYPKRDRKWRTERDKLRKRIANKNKIFRKI